MASSPLSILKNVLTLNKMHVDSCETETVTVSRDNEIIEQKLLDEYETRAKGIKDSKHALGHRPTALRVSLPTLRSRL